MSEKEAAPFKTKVLAVGGYALCSSMLLVINKLAVRHFPVHNVVGAVQLAFTALFVEVARQLGYAKVERFSMERIRPFFVYNAAFAGGIYTNMKAVDHVSVGAVIAAKSCLPIFVCFVEHPVLGRQLPNTRSCFALAGVLVTAILYALYDRTLQVKGVTGLFWLFAWFCLLAFQMVYGKFITEAHSSMSNWENVLYNNLFGMPWMFLFFIMSREPYYLIHHLSITNMALLWVSLSCVVAVGISYTGWLARSCVSASTYSLVGVLNKIVTVAANGFIYPGETGTVGILALLCCIVFGVFYEDPPKQTPRKSSSADSEA